MENKSADSVQVVDQQLRERAEDDGKGGVRRETKTINVSGLFLEKKGLCNFCPLSLD